MTLKVGEKAFKPESHKEGEHSAVGKKLMEDLGKSPKGLDQSHTVAAVKEANKNFKIEGGTIVGAGTGDHGKTPYLFVKGGDGKIYSVNADTGEVKGSFTVTKEKNSAGKETTKWVPDSTKEAGKGSEKSSESPENVSKNLSELGKKQADGNNVITDGKNPPESVINGNDAYVKNGDKVEHYTKNNDGSWKKDQDADNTYGKYNKIDYDQTNGNIKMSDGQGNEKTVCKSGTTITVDKSDSGTTKTVKTADGATLTATGTDGEWKIGTGDRTSTVKGLTVNADGSMTMNGKAVDSVKRDDNSGDVTVNYADKTKLISTHTGHSYECAADNKVKSIDGKAVTNGRLHSDGSVTYQTTDSEGLVHNCQIDRHGKTSEWWASKEDSNGTPTYITVKEGGTTTDYEAHKAWGGRMYYTKVGDYGLYGTSGVYYDVKYDRNSGNLDVTPVDGNYAPQGPVQKYHTNDS